MPRGTYHDMLHVISARCVARDLHATAPGPLERTCWRRFAAQWGDCKKSRFAPVGAIVVVVVIIIMDGTTSFHDRIFQYVCRDFAREIYTHSSSKYLQIGALRLGNVNLGIHIDRTQILYQQLWAILDACELLRCMWKQFKPTHSFTHTYLPTYLTTHI